MVGLHRAGIVCESAVSEGIGGRSDLENDETVLVFPVFTRLLDALLAEKPPPHLAERTGIVAATVATAQGPVVGIQLNRRFFSSHPMAPFETRIPRARSVPEGKHSQRTT